MQCIIIIHRKPAIVANLGNIATVFIGRKSYIVVAGALFAVANVGGMMDSFPPCRTVTQMTNIQVGENQLNFSLFFAFLAIASECRFDRSV